MDGPCRTVEVSLIKVHNPDGITYLDQWCDTVSPIYRGGSSENKAFSSSNWLACEITIFGKSRFLEFDHTRIFGDAIDSAAWNKGIKYTLGLFEIFYMLSWSENVKSVCFSDSHIFK